ncbi:lipid droplet-associated protein [Pseudonocardia humida]|uniref:Lipid droplet-associated protein n=1 Tax=Pseudonocardia humida TaxID=2800819 RepID=A0ABT1A3Q4_9PSEU|nr:lipid droplet-associated protein [Pseudonocardia humida]MCO1657640.1 lipid droplet-associated protein [Pseudonocardia humida]
MDDRDSERNKPLPLPVRIAAGLVATAFEQAKDLPRTVVELPVTAVSQVLQASMRVQQKVTELAIKGDRALGALRPVEEKPSWATFDEDLPPRRNGRSSSVTELRPQARPEPEPDPAPPSAGIAAQATAAAAAGTATLEPTDEDLPSAPPAAADLAGSPEPGSAPAPAGDAGPNILPGYADMTIPQLRGRLRRLSADDLRTLLDWELANGNRPPYVTMLTNRISTVTAE